VEVDGKEVRTTRGLPVSNKRLAGVQPGGIGRVDSAGIETVVGSVSVERIEQKKNLRTGLPLLLLAMTASVAFPAVPETRVNLSDLYLENLCVSKAG
jgi:hypothetical protein